MPDETKDIEGEVATSAPQFTEPPNWLTKEQAQQILDNQVEPVADVLLEKDGEETISARIWQRISSKLADALESAGIGRKSDDEHSAFKVAGNHFLCVWSNNFEDRDGEIFTAKAIDDFVTRVDMGIAPTPELWVWHVPGSRVGKADWVDRHGHFLMAMGTFDDTPHGQHARDYYQKHGGKKSLSHGFTYPADQFDGKHYGSFNTFEISLLPRGAEANLFTSLEGVKAMAKVISETKKAELFAAFGEELGTRILASEDAKGKALDELGIASKDFTADPAVAADTSAQALANADKAFKDLVPDLMEGSAEAVSAALEAVKAVKAQNAEIADLRKELDLMRAELRLRPRASQSQETEVEISHLSPALQQSLKEQNTVRHPFFGTEVDATTLR